MKRVAAVAVPRDIHKTFDYAIPENYANEIEPGARVEVPFRDETLTGFVVEIKSESDFKGRLSPIKTLIDREPVLGKRQLRLARWISDEYICPLGLVCPAMIPSTLGRRKRAKRNFVRLAQSFPDVIESIERLSRSAPQQANILKALLTKSETPLSKELLDEVGATSAPLKALEKKGLLEILRRSRPIEIESAYHETAEEHDLVEQQERSLTQISEALNSNSGSFLLHGVNASGKTEVYLRAARKCVEMGRQAIVLVPEISLTPQLLARFKNHFGERLASYHSQMTEAERDHEWNRMNDGEADVVVGVRSAVFAPLANLGLIIVDEEHEHTYKQEDPVPRYHARDVALKRAELESAVVVFGSATPSLESYEAAVKGELMLLQMPKRVMGSHMPQIQLVDQVESKRLISSGLERAINERLSRSEQTMLLLNLRGFSLAALCKSCRETQRCPACHLALVYHLREQRLVCHLCAKSYPVGKCRNCTSENLLFLGAGTEQAEHELQERFRGAQIARMDSDVMKRDAHGELLEAFRHGNIDILLGTQMIGLGLDFPNVTLVGILSADTMINIPDFRSGERTFQLLSQAIGRAGRGEKPSEVIIQTSQPENDSLQYAIRGEYKAFFHEELENRKLFNFPPLSRLIKITFQSKNEQAAEAEATGLYELLSSTEVSDIEVMEPSRAHPPILRGEYRFRVITKLRDLGDVRETLVGYLLSRKSSVQIKIDVDPGTLIG